MRARRSFAYGRSSARGARVVAYFAAALGIVALGSCDAPVGPTGDARPARLAVRAELHVADLIDGLNVRLRASYRRGDGSEQELSEAVVALADAASQQTGFNVEIARCLADRDRQQPGRACQTFIDVELRTGETTLDLQRIGPLALIPGQAVENVPTVTLSDSFTVEVTPAPDTLILGELREYAARVLDRSGAEAIRPFRWTSTNPAVLTVDSITGAAASLAPGATTVSATLRVGGWTGSSNVAVIDRGRIELSADSVRFAARVAGADPAPIVIAIGNSSPVPFDQPAATVRYIGATAAQWLVATVLALDGIDDADFVGNAADSVATLELVATRGTLAPGDYLAEVDVSADGAINSPQIVRVAFQVREAPVFAAVTAPAAFGATEGGATPDSVSVVIAAAGSDTIPNLALAVVYDDPAAPAEAWLTSALVNTVTPTTLTLTASPDGLAAGTYLASVRVLSPQAGDTAVVPVQLTVAPPARQRLIAAWGTPTDSTVDLTVSWDPSACIAALDPVCPASPSYRRVVLDIAIVGGSQRLFTSRSPLPTTNFGLATLSGDVAATGVEATALSAAGHADSQVVAIVRYRLRAGTADDLIAAPTIIEVRDSADVLVPTASTGAAANTIEVGDTVSLAALEPPVIGFASDTVALGAVVGGTATGSVVVRNDGPGTLGELVVDSVEYVAGTTGWLQATFSPLAPTAPAPLALAATADAPLDLAAGSYTARVWVSAPDAASARAVTVVLTVTEAPAIGVDPDSVVLTVGLGASATRSVEVTNTGAGTLSGIVVDSITYTSGVEGWLEAEFPEVPATAPTTLGLTISTGAPLNLAAAAYRALVWISSPDAPGGPVAVPLVLTVNEPPELRRAQIAHLGAAVCVLSAEGVLSCAGESGAFGLFGNGTSASSLVPVPTAPSPPFVQVSGVSGAHACALTAAGTAYCWGAGVSGQLGTGTQANQTTPTAVSMPEGASFRQIVTANQHTCALNANGALYCWGGNGSGQLGGGTAGGVRLLPGPVVPAPPGVTWVQVSARVGTTCAVAADGDAYCWGTNGSGQIGDGSTTNRSSPTRVLAPDGVSFRQISTGGSTTCAVSTDDLAYCWGSNGPDGRLGTGTPGASSPIPVPVMMPGGDGFATVISGSGHSCGLTAAGSAYCWGSNTTGELGDGTDLARSAPTPVGAPLGVAFVELALSSGSCGMTAARETFCWGSNASGQFGDGTVNGQRSIPHPTDPPPGVTFTQVSVGADASVNVSGCALTPQGDAYCWGSNTVGQVGDGTTIPRSRPTLVQAPAGVVFDTLVAAERHRCAIASNGDGYCWGLNDFGQLGDGSTATRNTPVRVAAPEGVTFAQIGVGSRHSCAVSTDGAAYCWGLNNGRVGDGTSTHRFTPTLVSTPVGITWAHIAPG